MTGAELYKALKYKEPVRYVVASMPGVVLYAKNVVAVIHTRDRYGKMLVSAELKDENGCLIRVSAKNVHYLTLAERVEYRKKKSR